MVVVNKTSVENIVPLTERDVEHDSSSSKRTRSGETGSDNGGCKRPRAESRRPTLTTVKEQVGSKRIRLFKWKESLFNDKYSDSGIFMIYVNNNTKDRTQSRDGTIVEQETEKNNMESVSLFKLELLQNIGDSMHPLAVLALIASNAFEEFDTIKALADEISTHISSNFRFTKRNLSYPRTERVVIFVEVDVFTTKEYRVIKDTESIMAMDQDCGNGGTNQEENDHHQPYLYVRYLEDDSMEPDTEETEEEEEEEAAAEIQLKVEDMKDFSGVVSGPELMEIQGMLWRCLEDWPEVIRVDPNFSRDSKGLKQVEDAMEIITEFHGNDKKVKLCPCCLEGFSEGATAVKTRCSHLFHRDCLCLWLSKKDSCPLCRSTCATLV